ncbi:hypothetical protein V8G54_032468 [Vigna mungo]|uniref:Prolamin-like domain-containing protein n=1 Tax=Vigna mungo TaxID=3915 RepID=A0AAQ3MM22_VIGMU
MAFSSIPFVLTVLVITAMVLNASVADSRALSDPSTPLSLALRACSGEIITFFLNGETYLGRSCCEAIRVIGHDCWPNLVGSLGFTSEETDVLEGYCDEAVHSPPPPPLSVDP